MLLHSIVARSIRYGPLAPGNSTYIIGPPPDPIKIFSNHLPKFRATLHYDGFEREEVLSTVESRLS